MEALALYMMSNSDITTIKIATRLSWCVRNAFLLAFEEHKHIWEIRAYNLLGRGVSFDQKNINWALVIDIKQQLPRYQLVKAIKLNNPVHIKLCAPDSWHTRYDYRVSFFFHNYKAISNPGLRYIIERMAHGVVEEILIRSVTSDNAPMLKRLLDCLHRSFDIKFKHQALFAIAVKYGQASIVATLLKHCPTLNPQYQRKRFRSSYIYIAHIEGYRNIVTMLLSDEQVRQVVLDKGNWAGLCSSSSQSDTRHGLEMIDRYM